jgi:hypothetical protein
MTDFYVETEHPAFLIQQLLPRPSFPIISGIIRGPPQGGRSGATMEPWRCARRTRSDPSSPPPGSCRCRPLLFLCCSYFVRTRLVLQIDALFVLLMLCVLLCAAADSWSAQEIFVPNRIKVIVAYGGVPITQQVWFFFRGCFCFWFIWLDYWYTICTF